MSPPSVTKTEIHIPAHVNPADCGPAARKPEGTRRPICSGNVHSKVFISGQETAISRLSPRERRETAPDQSDDRMLGFLYNFANPPPGLWKKPDLLARFLLKNVLGIKKELKNYIGLIKELRGPSGMPLARQYALYKQADLGEKFASLLPMLRENGVPEKEITQIKDAIDNLIAKAPAPGAEKHEISKFARLIDSLTDPPLHGASAPGVSAKHPSTKHHPNHGAPAPGAKKHEISESARLIDSLTDLPADPPRGLKAI